MLCWTVVYVTRCVVVYVTRCVVVYVTRCVVVYVTRCVVVECCVGLLYMLPGVLLYMLPGVLMLNAVLTVKASQANSHKDRGWEKLTDATISYLNKNRSGLVFMLWGSYAQKKGAHIDKVSVCVHTFIMVHGIFLGKFFFYFFFSHTIFF